MNQNKTTDATPDQLLQMLEQQIAMQHTKRRSGVRHRGLILAGGLLLIIGAAFGALLLLQQMLLDAPRPERSAKPAEQVVAVP